VVDLNGTFHRLHRTVTEGQHAIARRIDYPSTVAPNVPAEDLTVLCKGVHSRGLTVGHQPGIAGHIGGENHL